MYPSAIPGLRSKPTESLPSTASTTKSIYETAPHRPRGFLNERLVKPPRPPPPEKPRFNIHSIVVHPPRYVSNDLTKKEPKEDKIPLIEPEYEEPKWPRVRMVFRKHHRMSHPRQSSCTRGMFITLVVFLCCSVPVLIILFVLLGLRLSYKSL